MEILLLLTLSIIPSILFLVYILYMDRNEQEPLKLVLKTMLWGGLFVIPAVIVEVGLASFFPIFTDVHDNITITILQAFVQVAFIEEVCKIAPVLVFTWRNPEFNEENDGIVYTGASALGFATLENIFYVLEKGWGVGIMRAVSSIPLHCFTGVIAGYYIGLAKFSNSPQEAMKKIFIGFLFAYLFHGFYDAFALSGTALAILVLPTVVLIWIFGVKLLKKGRELSLIRWQNINKNEPTNISELPVSHPSYPKQKLDKEITLSNSSGKWKVWTSRMILLGVAIFWGLLLTGVLTTSTSEEIFQSIVGGIVLTVIPTTVAIFLQVSFYKSRQI